MRFESINPTRPVEIGQETTYRISVTNQGADDDLNVDVMVKLPRGMCFMEGHGDSDIRAQGQIVRFQRIGRLRPGCEVAWNIVVRTEFETHGQLEVSMTSDATRYYGPQDDRPRSAWRSPREEPSGVRSSTRPQFGGLNGLSHW